MSAEKTNQENEDAHKHHTIDDGCPECCPHGERAHGECTACGDVAELGDATDYGSDR